MNFPFWWLCYSSGFFFFMSFTFSSITPVCVCMWPCDTAGQADLFPLLPQSLSAPQAQTLSCVESLCCYQHGQSGCSRLARFLEHMTGQCRTSADHHHRRHTTGHGNRWAAACGVGGAKPDRVTAGRRGFTNFALASDALTWCWNNALCCLFCFFTKLRWKALYSQIVATTGLDPLQWELASPNALDVCLSVFLSVLLVCVAL